MKRIIIFLAGISLVPAFCHGQSCKQPFLGSKTLYQYQQQKYSPPPKDYLPVFINHVGRHGSRHLTKDVNSSYIYQLLLQADSLNELSADGKLLKEKVLRLEKVEKKNFKSITYQGKTEQVGLADRMYANYPATFLKQPAPVTACCLYTKEIRTLQTSDAFLGELETHINEACHYQSS
jgi:multiple inositol-polyphosphate phosphatase/2,3-bisphosphoglycerate 3-phosphatase